MKTNPEDSAAGLKTRLLAAGQPGTVAFAAERLRAGDLLAFPTDTVYGLGAISTSPEAIARIYVVKGRTLEKAIPVLLANANDLPLVAERVTPAARALADAFWPGALTLIVPRRPDLPPDLSSGPNIAVRIPDYPLTLDLIRAAGTPLATTSANLSGNRSPRTAQEVLEDLKGRIPYILDGGPCPVGVPSTVVDCTVSPVRILRLGAIGREALQKVVAIGA